MTIPDHYFEVRNFHKSELGDKIIILYQVGSFYEMYSKKINGDLEDKNIKDFTSKINFKMSKYKESNIWFAGISVFNSLKYIKLAKDLGYTIVVYNQEKNHNNIPVRNYYKTF